LSTRLIRLSDVETSPGDRVFRYSPTRIALLALAGACVAAALVLVDWEGRRRSAYYIAYYIAGVLFLGLVLMRRFFLARLRSSNWLARMRDDGLLIQFRSYLNYHLPGGDVTVIFIPYQDIRSARLVRERTKIEAQDGTTEETCRLVELELAGDLTPLSKALAAEPAKPAPGRRPGMEIHRLFISTIQCEWSVHRSCRWNGRSCRTLRASWMPCDLTPRLPRPL